MLRGSLLRRSYLVTSAIDSNVVRDRWRPPYCIFADRSMKEHAANAITLSPAVNDTYTSNSGRSEHRACMRLSSRTPDAGGEIGSVTEKSMKY